MNESSGFVAETAACRRRGKSVPRPRPSLANRMRKLIANPCRVERNRTQSNSAAYIFLIANFSELAPRTTSPAPGLPTHPAGVPKPALVGLAVRTLRRIATARLACLRSDGGFEGVILTGSRRALRNLDERVRTWLAKGLIWPAPSRNFFNSSAFLNQTNFIQPQGGNL